MGDGGQTCTPDLFLYTEFVSLCSASRAKMFAHQSRYIPMLLISALLLVASSSRLSGQNTLRIGVIDRAAGSMLAGARLAADQVNAAGGIVGADGSVYQLSIVDTPPDHMEIATANMRQARVIAVIGPATNHDVARNIARLQEIEAPILTPATGETILFADSSNRILRSRARESLQINGLADFLVNSLGIDSVQMVQLDSASTASLIMLANALAAHGIRPSNLRYDGTRSALDQIAASISKSAPDAVAIYGPPVLSAQAYLAIRDAGYLREIVYAAADDPDFIEVVPADALPGIISASTWSYALDDAASQSFTLDYALAFGKLPDALSAAGYDAVALIAQAASGSGTLAAELAAIQSFRGAQGPLNPADQPPAEISSNVVVTRLNEYGAPFVVARYPQAERLTSQTQTAARVTSTPEPISTPVPSSTPTGYHLIVQSQFQNVRSGPGLEYEVIGQVLQGSQLRVLGATADYSWLVIDFRGQWGWLAAYLVETFGNRNLAPIVQPPATSTPAPTATTSPPQEPDLVVLAADPKRITLGQATSINVTLRNQGLTAAGRFAIAGTFEPGAQYVSAHLPGLGAGQQTTAQLQPTLMGRSGPQSVIIVVDLNQEVYEGPQGETNNQRYSYNYIADRPVLNSGASTIAPGAFDLDGDAIADFAWTGNDMVAQGSAAMLPLSHFASLDEVHYDAIDGSQATNVTINADQLTNATIGIVTADGHLGAMRVSNVTRNGSLAMEYRIYR